MQTITIAGFFDELEKVSARKAVANWMQSRSGIRPIRVQTLLNKDRAIEDPDALKPEEQKNVDEGGEDRGDEPIADGGDDGISKAAEILTKKRREKALHGFANVRPYVSSAVAAGVPAAVLGNIYGGKRTAKLLGAVGAASGATNEALKRWAEKNKRRSSAKALLEE